MRQNKRFWKNAGAILFWIALWQFAAQSVGVELLVPTPLRTLRTLCSMLVTKQLWLAVFSSIARIAAGFCLAFFAGTLCAVLSHRAAWFRTLFSPLIHLVRSVPVVSFIILALVWIRANFLPVFICFLMVFPMVWANVEEGLNAVDGKLLEVCRVMRVGKYQTLRAVYLPSLMPAMRAACVTGIGFAWKSGVAAEVLCKPKNALGTLLANGKFALDTPQVFAVTLVVVALSLLLDALLRKLWRVRDAEV